MNNSNILCKFANGKVIYKTKIAPSTRYYQVMCRMEQENIFLTPEEQWQQSEDERLEYEGYCRKIIQGLENQDEKSGVRAIWELVQNAKDQSKEARIKMELTDKSFIFAHHGTPFDYTSLRALVKQDSSKDRADANIVGQYGTGFMTTHTFNRLVYVSAPYAVKSKDGISGYVQIVDFPLDRTKVDTAEGPKLMRKQLNDVKDLCKKTKSQLIENDTTSFRYDLKPEQVSEVSGYLESAIRLMPFVLVLNDSICEVEVDDRYQKKNYLFKKSGENKLFQVDITGWIGAEETIEIFNLENNNVEICRCKCLRSVQGDVVIIPPYPEICGSVEDIPSLFLWFPLLGTENFGVNFIFHSKRFYPVEKRNNIMLPGISEISKIKGGENEQILKEMMAAVFAYYRKEEHAKELNIKMCQASFSDVCDNEETLRFYKEMQELWKQELPNWKVLPIGDEWLSVNDERVRLLHPDFFSKLTPDLCVKYESVMAQYAVMVTRDNEEKILIPTKDLIAWSRTVDRWQCEINVDFFVTVAEVCEAIKDNRENLHTFLMSLKDSGNEKLMDEYALLPNRKGNLCLKNALYYGDFVTNDVYELVKTVMGDDETKMFNPQYLDVCTVNPYTKGDLQKAIGNTVQQWRNQTLNRQNGGSLTEEQLDSLIKFCSATMLTDFKNQRGRMMPILTELYEKEFVVISTIKYREDEEEEFYKPAFNFLLDYTLAQICKKDVTWVEAHKEWLLKFLTEYNPKENEERKKRLDTYSVLPNQVGTLCLKGELKARRDVPDEMVDIYKAIFGKDLREEWIDENFDGIVDFQPVHSSDVADEIEKALVTDMKQEGGHKLEKIVRKIILKIGDSKEWEGWFGQINEKKAAYTFSMQSGRAQKSLFSLMDNCSEEHLEQLAKYGKNIDGLLDKLDSIEKQERDSATRFNHLHTIGKHIEDILRERIGQDLISIKMPESKDVNYVDVDDEQNGQDIVVKVKKNGEWKNIYFVEVKSKWDFNEAAHMSMRQVRMASLNPNMYALCCVDLRSFKDQNLANLEESVILNATHVKMDVGKTLFPMVAGILDADKQPDETFIKISDYRSNIPAKVFEVGEPFDALLTKIEQKAREVLSQL